MPSLESQLPPSDIKKVIPENKGLKENEFFISKFISFDDMENKLIMRLGSNSQLSAIRLRYDDLYLVTEKLRCRGGKILNFEFKSRILNRDYDGPAGRFWNGYRINGIRDEDVNDLRGRWVRFSFWFSRVHLICFLRIFLWNFFNFKLPCDDSVSNLAFNMRIDSWHVSNKPIDEFPDANDKLTIFGWKRAKTKMT